MSLNAFLKENAEVVGVVEYAPSKRFKNENGELAIFKIRAITGKKDSELRKDCYIRTDNKLDFNSEKYISKLVETCVVEPNLNSEELLTSYGVMNSEELLSIMLTAGESQRLVQKVQEVNGFNEKYTDKIEKAKN